MRYRAIKKRPQTELRVTGEEHRAEYNRLVTLYRVVEYGDGIKSLVISCFQVSGIWGLTHQTWGDFCREVLHTSKSQAARLASEGDVARRLLSGDPFMLELKNHLKSTKITENIVEEYHRGTEPPFLPGNSHVLAESRHAFIARDRSLLRLIKAAPAVKWSEIAEESSKNGHPTKESVKAAVAKLAPKASQKPKRTDADLPDVLKPSPLDPLRAALREALTYFVALYEMDDAKLTKAASSVFEYCRRISKAAKAI